MGYASADTEKRPGRFPRPGSNLVHAWLLEWKDSRANVSVLAQPQSKPLFDLTRQIHKAFSQVTV